MAAASDDTPDPPQKPVSDEDEKILKELNDRYDYASVQWAPIIARADLCLSYSGGNTWNTDDKAARAGRQMLKLDQLSQYTNQLVNSFRTNPRGAKVSQAGDGATERTAEVRSDRLRQIEHDSHAQEVYTVSAENMVTRGYGYARIVAEYEDEESDNQSLKLKAIPNPNQVLPDPDAESTSGADWDYLFFVHTITQREHQRDFPNSIIKDFEPSTMATLPPKWFGKDGRVQIAEYWYVTETPNKKGKGRPKRTVCMYLTNGVELLQKKGYPKKTEWPGSTIPFASAYGKISYANDETGETRKWCDAYIWLALDAAKAYNWTKSTELEALALPVRASLKGYKGQATQLMIDEIARSTREPVPWLEFSATLEETGSAILPLPQYGTQMPDIQGYEIAAESFRRDVQNALGHYSSNDARQGSTKVISGAALDELRKSGDLGSYHYVAHYDDFVRELAVKMNELLQFYDDTPKPVPTRQADGKTKIVDINTKTARDVHGHPVYGPKDVPMDVGRHIVTVETGPAFESQREANSEFADSVLANPVIPQILGPQKTAALYALSVKMKGAGALGDQMAEIMDPQPGPDGPQADPKQLQQQLSQAQQQLQDAHGVMQQQESDLKSNQADNQTKMQIAQMTAASRERLVQLQLQDKQADREVKLAVAEIESKSKDAALFMDERNRLGVQQDAAAQRTHEIVMHHEKLTSAERIAAANRQTQMDAANAAARSAKSVQFTKGPDGSVQSATITGDPSMGGGNGGDPNAPQPAPSDQSGAGA